jgi:hypothetical protein
MNNEKYELAIELTWLYNFANVPISDLKYLELPLLLLIHQETKNPRVSFYTKHQFQKQKKKADDPAQLAPIGSIAHKSRSCFSLTTSPRDSCFLLWGRHRLKIWL